MEILSSHGLLTETIPDGPARPWRTTNGSRLFLYFCGSIFTRRPTRRNRQIEISKSRVVGNLRARFVLDDGATGIDSGKCIHGRPGPGFADDGASGRPAATRL